MAIKLLTEQHLEFLSLTGGCTGSSESTLVKIPHCWKSHAAAQISNIETIWSEISMPNSKPFPICTSYRPLNATSDWINKLEAELSVAQSSGLELILMGDINIDYRSCSNTK